MAALSLLLIINLALSYSWGSAAFGIAIIFLIIMRIRLSKRKALISAAAIAVFALFAILGALIMLGPTPQLPQSTRGERYVNMAKIANPSLFGRLFMYQKTIPLILDHLLLGTGPGNFIYAFTQYRPLHTNILWNYAHNDYLQIASELGLIGLTFFLLFVIMALTKGISHIKSAFIFNQTNEKNAINEIIAITAWTGILSALLHSLLDGNLSVVPEIPCISTLYSAS